MLEPTHIHFIMIITTMKIIEIKINKSNIDFKQTNIISTPPKKKKKKKKTWSK